jgi:hypothetical protein
VATRRAASATGRAAAGWPPGRGPWVFGYNTREFIETDDLFSMLLGNAPIVIDRQDGSVHEIRAGGPPDAYLEKHQLVGQR